jgi:formylglycine-generating enzyme required for sulfatase activity
MTFTLETWQQQAAEKLSQAGHWLKRRAGQDAPYLVYGTLSGLSLWPLVEVARSGGLTPLEIGLTLGGVAGAVGTDLLANQLQAWKDRAEAPDEAEVADWVAHTAPTDPELRQALDAIIEKLQALPQLRAGLSSADQAWFEQTLRRELAQLGNLARFEAILTGSGAIAQGPGAVAVGEKATYVGRDYTVVNEFPPQMLELFARQFGFDPSASDAEALRMYFNNVVLERHSKLSFLFIRPETGKVYTEADVETVFVPLEMVDTSAMQQRQAKLARRLERFDRPPRDMDEAAQPLTLPELLHQHRCFLLRGKPGCGKTTLLRHIALAFARGEHREKLGWNGPAPLPLLVPLRNFGAFLKSRASRYVEPQPRALLEYLEDHLRGAGVRFSPDFLRRRLEAGQCFLLLDALDEASGTLDGGGDLRAAVARQVAAFIRHYLPKGNRFGLTSRPRAYQEESAMRQALPQPVICDVLDLDPAGYQQLITNLLVVLANNPEVGQAEATDLCERIAPNRHLTDLAGNPLLCTTLVLVYKYRGRKLPERRVDVLHEIVTLLLGRWEEERHGVSSPDELARLGTTASTTEQAIQFRRRALVALAWHMQQDTTPETPTETAVQTLAQFYCDEERADQVTAEKWARAFLSVAHERSGLFIALDEGRHTFAHQAFREYLAATQLVNAGEASLLKEVMRHAPRPDEWWEQVILLAGAHPELSSGASGRLVETLLAKGDLAWASLAARCAQDMTDKLPGVQRKRLQDRLLAWIRDEARPPQERAQAGVVLALAGDPRFRADAGHLPDELMLGFVKIPAGPFLLGTRAEDIPALLQQFMGGRKWYERETPQHTVDLPAYYIGRYPVTVAQWRAFVKESGHQPTDKHSLDGPDNHPVRYVTWYEAIAYCRWVEVRLGQWAKESGSSPDLLSLAELIAHQDWRVTLPSEAEWEKAARGTDGRNFPWGNQADPNRANYSNTGIRDPSTVGCFPGGVSPYGCEEMSGNVWEWCRTQWQDSYKNYRGDNNLEGNTGRVLRGGAFYDFQGNARCAFRNWNLPSNWSYDFGFRVVVSPIL